VHKTLHELSIPSGLFTHAVKRIERKRYNCLEVLKMTTSIAGLLAQPRPSNRSESNPLDLTFMTVKQIEIVGNTKAYPGSLGRRYQHAESQLQYRSMLDIDEPPSLCPIDLKSEESMEDCFIENIREKARKHKTNDWADILCFYTATNGVAQAAAPTRASPVPNGKPKSPMMDIPQSVSSSDPKIAAQQASDMRNIVRRKLTGYVGFANLPNQWHRKSVRKGFNFNVMVVGMY
jgi:septin 7